MKVSPRLLIAISLIFCLTMPAVAGRNSLLDQAKKTLEEAGTGKTTQGAPLSSSERTKGLKEALNKAVDSSVRFLGKPDGFLDNGDVKIPVPEHLRKVETALRKSVGPSTR